MKLKIDPPITSLGGRNLLRIWCSPYCTNPAIALPYGAMIQLRFQQETPTNSNFLAQSCQDYRAPDSGQVSAYQAILVFYCPIGYILADTQGLKVESSAVLQKITHSLDLKLRVSYPARLQHSQASYVMHLCIWVRVCGFCVIRYCRIG
jgi:hypothetical protein